LGPQAHNTTLETVIAQRREEADGIISLELMAADGSQLPPFEAGSHIDLHLGDGLVRQYSLCGNPRDLSRYRLGVLLEPQSRGGSRAVHERLLIGARARISLPRNHFGLVESAAHSILMAGGIGITPMLSMAWRLAELDASFDLHYCTRSLTRTAFRHLLTEHPYAGHLTLHLDDGPQAQKFDCARLCGEPQAGKHLYVCGPGGFMSYVINAAERLGWAPQNVHREYFSSTVDLSGDVFCVRAARSGIQVTVPAAKSIAAVLMENGVNVPLSCESGVCGTCLTRVLEGTPDHRDMYQTDDEKSSNTQMTLCCSRSKTPLLVLDI
jgi:vanillate monooxygenase ferredoxin subunit